MSPGFGTPVKKVRDTKSLDQQATPLQAPTHPLLGLAWLWAELSYPDRKIAIAADAGGAGAGAVDAGGRAADAGGGAEDAGGAGAGVGTADAGGGAIDAGGATLRLGRQRTTTQVAA